jgi:hypothetical protein
MDTTKAAKLAISAYMFAFLMAVISVVPGLNYLYSGHGGPAWLLLPFVFPVALIRLYWAVRVAPVAERARVKRFALLSIIAYLPLSLMASYFGCASIERTFGLPVGLLTMWGLFTMPFGLVFVLR